MTPDQLTALKSVAEIIKTLGALPLGALLSLIILGPWGVLILTSWEQNRRYQGVVQMYQDNVQLVKDYRDLVAGYKKIVDGQQDLIIHTTQTLTTVKEVAENNLYCPMVRTTTRSQTPHG